MLGADTIKRIAAEVGFDLCGICPPRNFSAEREFFRGWLERGFHGGLRYLERNVDKRFSMQELMPGVRSAIVCAVSYKNDSSMSDAAGFCDIPRIASYARSRDYHSTIKDMLAGMAARLAEVYGAFPYRTFVDTAPVLEKRLAAEAGLGFIGRNTLLVSPVLGSFVLLGEILTGEEVDQYDDPYAGAGCGRCGRCVDHCPVQALTDGGIDAGRCIAGVTIERAGGEEGCKERHGWIFGCDECQQVCPYNVAAPTCTNHRFRPLFDPAELSAERWLGMSEEEFGARFSATPLARSGLQGLRQLLLAKP